MTCSKSPTLYFVTATDSKREVIHKTKEMEQYQSLNGNPTTKSSSIETTKEQQSSSLCSYQNIHQFLKTYQEMFSIRFVMLCMVCSFLNGLGYYSALIYYVAYSVDSGISKTKAAFLLSIFGIAAIFGRLGYGPFIDKRIVTSVKLAMIMGFVNSVICMLNGVLAKSYAGLVVFSVVFGISTGSGNGIFPIITKDVVGVLMVKKAFGLVVIMWNFAGLVGVPLMGENS